MSKFIYTNLTFLEKERTHTDQCMMNWKKRYVKNQSEVLNKSLNYFIDLSDIGHDTKVDKTDVQENLRQAFFVKVEEKILKNFPKRFNRRPFHRSSSRSPSTECNENVENFSMQSSDREYECKKICNSCTSVSHLKQEHSWGKLVKQPSAKKSFYDFCDEVAVSPKMTRSYPEINPFQIYARRRTQNSLAANNIPSLLRIFPDLNSELVKSTPCCYENNEVSSISSLLSDNIPYCRHRPRSAFGIDLLTIFLKEICWDINIFVKGENRSIKAHKKILSARCLFFASLFSGSSQTGGEIVLDGYLYKTVHFALCHIYAGHIKVPLDVNLEDLSSLSSALLMDGLQSTLNDVFTTQYCHCFHRPCHECVHTGLKCLKIIYRTDNDIFRPVLAWVKDYIALFEKSPEFFEIQAGAIDAIYMDMRPHINYNNVIDRINFCNSIVSKRHGESLLAMETIVERCRVYITKNLCRFIYSEGYQKIKEDPGEHLSGMVESTVLNATEKISPDVALKAYSYLNILISETGPSRWKTLNEKMSTRCEQILIRAVLASHLQPQWEIHPNVLPRAMKQHVNGLLHAVRVATNATLIKFRRRTYSKQEEKMIIHRAIDDYYILKKEVVETARRSDSPKMCSSSAVTPKSLRQDKPAPKVVCKKQIVLPFKSETDISKSKMCIKQPLSKSANSIKPPVCKTAVSKTTVVKNTVTKSSLPKTTFVYTASYLSKMAENSCAEMKPKHSTKFGRSLIPIRIASHSFTDTKHTLKKAESKNSILRKDNFLLHTKSSSAKMIRKENNKSPSVSK